MIDRKELEDILNAMNDKQRVKLAYNFIKDRQGIVNSAYILKHTDIGNVMFSYIPAKTKSLTPERADIILKLVLDGIYDLISQIKNADKRIISGDMKLMSHKDAFRIYVDHNNLLMIDGKEVYSKNLKTHPDAVVISEGDKFLVLKAKGKEYKISKREFKRKYNW